MGEPRSDGADEPALEAECSESEKVEVLCVDAANEYYGIDV